MADSPPDRGSWRGRRRAAVVLCAAVCPVAARHARAQELGEKAAEMHAALESKPRGERRRGDYQAVLDAYMAAVRAGAQDPDTPALVSATATLLAEEGRLFRDQTVLLHAVGEYELLRQQYPESDYCASALLHEGEIYERDLHDRNAARAVFAEFLRDYPESRFASQARAQLRSMEMNVPEVGNELATDLHASGAEPVNASAARRQESAHGNELTRLYAASSGASAEPPTAPSAVPAALSRRGPVALVTGVRHWSTPVYTRVAIDLENQVEYEAARVPDPDRIYFDLHGARVARGLAGKSVQVTDDGFLKRIRVAQYSNDVTRIVLDVNRVSEYSAFLLPNPWRLIIDVHGSSAQAAQESAGLGRSAQLAGAMHAADNAEIATLDSAPRRIQATRTPTTRPIAASVAGAPPAAQSSRPLALAPGVATASVATHGGERITPPPATASEALRRTGSPAPSGDVAVAANAHRSPTAAQTDEAGYLGREAAPTADGQRSLVRALGLKIGRIVIDAGHGGYDSGTLGADGLQEKDVTLDVALRLGKLLRERLGADVIYTRNTDTFIPLETRTAIANKAQADLFISIHANSSPNPEARGVETYYLNFTTSPDALEVAARENAVSDQSIHELSDLVKKITLKDKIDESREFAADVNRSLYTGLETGNAGLRDRGVKKAPFVVLIGANMPSVLAEISFLTNPEDASELRKPAYRERIAESLYRGVARYVDGLSGVHIAQAAQTAAGGR